MNRNEFLVNVCTNRIFLDVTRLIKKKKVPGQRQVKLPQPTQVPKTERDTK